MSGVKRKTQDDEVSDFVWMHGASTWKGGRLSPSVINIKARIAVAGGTLIRFTHESTSTQTTMTAAVFMPPGVEYSSEIPAIYWLSGLTCTDENFSQKAGAFGHAAREKIAIVIPDTSPRGAGVPGEDDAWDFGTGAGFYIDATTDKYAKNYKMFTYITNELPALVEAEFKISPKMRSISGHSMGGHGALTIALKDRGESWVSVSAFAPICNPTRCPWGIKAFEGYLGSVDAGMMHDATELMKKGPYPKLGEILLDQGVDDDFLAAGQLKPEEFESAAKAVKQVLQRVNSKTSGKRDADADADAEAEAGVPTPIPSIHTQTCYLSQY